MKWFRSNIRQGSRLALFALALQFALSFGHFHGIAAQAAPGLQSGLAQSISLANSPVAPDVADKAAGQEPASGHDTDRQNSDACAICAVIALAGNLLPAMPPVLLLPQAVELPYVTADTEFALAKPAHSAFQSRAPPRS